MKSEIEEALNSEDRPEELAYTDESPEEWAELVNYEERRADILADAEEMQR